MEFREGFCRRGSQGEGRCTQSEERRRGNKRTIDFIDKGADSQAPAIANELFISTSTKHWHYDEATGDGSAMPVKGRDSSYLQTGRQWQFVFTDRGCQWQLTVHIYRQVVSVAVHIHRDREGVSDSSYSHKQRGCQGQFVFTETGGVSGSVSGIGSGSGSSLLTGMCFARNGSRVPALLSPCRFNNV